MSAPLRPVRRSGGFLVPELHDEESAGRRLEIRGLPAGRVGSGNREEWPSLPGAAGSPERSRLWGVDSSSWVTNFEKSRFNLGDSQWPLLASRQEGRKREQEEGDEDNPRFSSLLERNGVASIEREDIPGSKGPTRQHSHQQLHHRDGRHGFVRDIHASGKGWMRLPPISMPPSSSSSFSNHQQQQQQQKRCRQAAFLENSTSNPSSPEELTGGIFGDGSSSSSSPSTGAYFPPVYLMLNKDFVVISPLKENLLLTLALTQHKRVPSSPPSDDDDDDHVSAAAQLFEHESSSIEVAQVAAVAASVAAATVATSTTSASSAAGDAKRRQVFVGRFEAFSSFVKFGLGRDAMRVATESNAGGTSTISESLSVEYFVRKFKATEVVTEMEVEYCAMNWKKVDYICNLYGQRVGVSVTRAMSYPNPGDFSPQMANRLLYKKLFGLVVARHGVTHRHSFSQCVLHVWCETTTTAKLLQAQYKEVSEELDITDDVIMVLTVAEGWHARPIFYESCLVRD